MTRFRLPALTRADAALAGIATVALTVRVVACVVGNNHVAWNDATVYQFVARSLADGDGFQRPFSAEPTAEHPPLWEVVLAGGYLLGLDSTLSVRLIGAVIGTVTVVLVGLLGRRLAGNGVGLTAAGIGAVYPMLWAADITIMSETLYGALLVGALLAAAHRRPVVLGGLIGLAALTRGEGLALVVLLAVPLFWRRWRELALAVVACAVVLTPWTVRNLATFSEPVLISSNANSVLAGANCDKTYYGEWAGYWIFDCLAEARPGEDESTDRARQRDQATRYMAEHADRVPAVMGIRVLRLLDAWDVGQSVNANAGDGRPARFTQLGIVAFWALLPFAVAGGILLRRRRDALVILLAPAVMIFAVSIVTYGSTRLRYAAEPSIVMLAAVALVALSQRIARRQPTKPVDIEDSIRVDSRPRGADSPRSRILGEQPVDLGRDAHLS